MSSIPFRLGAAFWAALSFAACTTTPPPAAEASKAAPPALLPPPAAKRTEGVPPLSRRSLQQRGTPVWYLLADNEGHGFAKRENVDYHFAAMLQFLQQTLKP